MKRTNKRALYETLMSKIAKEVKHAVNEAFVLPDPGNTNWTIDVENFNDMTTFLCITEDSDIQFFDESDIKYGFEDSPEDRATVLALKPGACYSPDNGVHVYARLR